MEKTKPYKKPYSQHILKNLKESTTFPMYLIIVILEIFAIGLLILFFYYYPQGNKGKNTFPKNDTISPLYPINKLLGEESLKDYLEEKLTVYSNTDYYEWGKLDHLNEKKKKSNSILPSLFQEEIGIVTVDNGTWGNSFFINDNDEKKIS